MRQQQHSRAFRVRPGTVHVMHLGSLNPCKDYAGQAPRLREGQYCPAPLSGFTANPATPKPTPHSSVSPSPAPLKVYTVSFNPHSNLQTEGLMVFILQLRELKFRDRKQLA